MKTCDACSEVFESDFSFCPICGLRFTEKEFRDKQLLHLTLIEDAHLAKRLSEEAVFLATRAREAWPVFRKDPLAFTKSQLAELKGQFKRTFRRPYALAGLMTAPVLVLLLVVVVSLLDTRTSGTAGTSELEEVSVLTTTIDLSSASEAKREGGIGAREAGRAGFNRGKGEGSNPLPARAQGGGSGGTRNPLPPSQGKPPVASPIPAPIPTTYARLPQALPAAGLDIDPALWRNLDFASYGDPRSRSTTSSNGPGEGGGVGTNTGQGIGEGEGPGFGKGRKGNMGDGDKGIGGGREGGGPGCDTPGCTGRLPVYRVGDVTQRARVLVKPEPQYTELARKNGTTGTVVLRVIFSSSGEVTNIQAVQKLGDGLTEKAIAAAKQIRFVPATRNGQVVSMYMQLEYNFNLY